MSKDPGVNAILLDAFPALGQLIWRNSDNFQVE